MVIIHMIDTIKKIHPEEVVLVKVGTFYTAYGKDAYIINYIFGYKLIQMQQVDIASFPISILNKVMSILERNKVNYIVLDKRNNYDVEHKSDKNNINNYSKILKKAKVEINLNKRINEIIRNLKEDKEALIEVEKILYERRKI